MRLALAEHPMRLALVQLELRVGDVDGNAAAIAAAYRHAAGDGADLVVAPELAITGYPPEDLLRRQAFVAAAASALEDLAAATGETALVVGTVQALPWGSPPAAAASTVGDQPPLANVAAVLRRGGVEAVYRKQRLPNYGVFDEARYFVPGQDAVVVDVAGVAVGVTVCEDMWGGDGPVAAAARAGAQLVVNVNASPYHRSKRGEREGWAAHHATTHEVALAYVNAIGGQDEVVFDGASFAMGADGTVAVRGATFATDVVAVDVAGPHAVTAATPSARPLEPLAETWAALVTGTGDYVRKNGFSGALVGVSGGIDSAVSAAVAVDALGSAQVTLVAMPAPHSSAESLADARALAANLDVELVELPIASAMEAFQGVLAKPLAGPDESVAWENLQSRIRATLLMTLSNAWGRLLLATGNKSEYAVGYATLYGDMAGGFAVIKDVPKLLVYELARHRNAVADGEVIPARSIEKPPSAELRPGQRDTDSLPPYEVLDPILEAYIEADRSPAEIVADGFDTDVVHWVARLVDRAEHKRRQAAPGVKITRRAFGKDRRLPITQSWTR
jgi:NAD+ synthase (glutamine-hydrolysing)